MKNIDITLHKYKFEFVGEITKLHQSCKLKITYLKGFQLLFSVCKLHQLIMVVSLMRFKYSMQKWVRGNYLPRPYYVKSGHFATVTP